ELDDDPSWQDANEEHPLARQFTRDDEFDGVDDEVISDHPLAERDSARRARIELPADLDAERGFDDLEAALPDVEQAWLGDSLKKLRRPNTPATPIDEDRDAKPAGTEEKRGNRTVPRSLLGIMMDNAKDGSARPSRPRYGATGSIVAEDDSDRF